MADNAITSRRPQFGNGALVLEDYSNAAITTGTSKREWICPFNAHIADVIADSETANGNTDADDVIDVNVNGTTIYTTQANRPTLAQGDTGLFVEAAEPEVTRVNAGDIISYDVDAVDSGGGSARFKIAIVLQQR